MKKKSFHVRTRKVVFSKGPIHLVDCEVKMPDGRILSRQILEHPGAVVIIPESKPGKYILIRQFRFAAKDWLWEWPAGGIDSGESLRTAAARELAEEIGMKPRSLKQLLTFYPTPGISGEIMYLFLAKDLYPCIAECDEDEDIEKREFSLAQIQRMIRTGEICDAKTILGFHYLKQCLTLKR